MYAVCSCGWIATAANSPRGIIIALLEHRARSARHWDVRDELRVTAICRRAVS